MSGQSTSLPEFTEKLLSAARLAGADAADALASMGSAIEINVRSGVLEQAERSEAMDLGLRVFIGQRQAVVSGSDLRDDTLSTMAERAVAMAKEAPDDPYAGLAAPEQLAMDWNIEELELYDAQPEPSAAALEADALAAEAAALRVAGIEQVDAASASYGSGQVHFQTSAGFAGGYQRSSRSISCVAIAGSGLQMERDYEFDNRIFQEDLTDPAEIGANAGARAVARLKPSKPPTGQFPVLFDERVASSLIGHFLSAINGASVARGSSWLLEGLGQQVFPDGTQLIEDPHRPRVAGSRPFDGEGLPTQRRALVENGVLTGWTLDLASARHLSMPPTGNASRGVSAPPSPSNWNITLMPGQHTQADLIRDMGTGLLVTSMIGSTINPNTGDYSRGAAGVWVENGVISHPVSECTIAGNLRDMLRGFIAANDARAHLSRRVPSLLIDGMTIAGG